MPYHTVAAGYPRGLLDFAIAQGADRVALLQRAGIDAATLSHPDNRVPVSNYVALFKAAAELTGIPHISLEYGKAVRMQEISIVGLICEACESVRDVPVQLNRYAQLVVDESGGEPAVLMRGRMHDGGVWIEGPSAFFSENPHVVEAEFARLVWNTRVMFANTPEFRGIRYPIVVHFMHAAPAYASEFERIFEAPVLFGCDWNALQIDPAFLSLNQPPVNRYVFSVLSERAEMLLKSFEDARSMRGRVESVLGGMLHTGEASVDRVADKLGMSRQTLYRNLKEENLTYEQVLDDLRRRLALDFLAGKKVSVNETAYLLGFSDPASFSRAFKRWTGKNPSEVRGAR